MVGEFFELNSDEYKYQNALSLNLTVGYQINSKISLGIGTGYDNYSSRKNPNGPPAIIPLYLDLAGDLFHKAVTPYYKLSAGYGFASPTKTQRSFENITYKGGLLVHPSIGIKFFTRHDLAWYIDFGYRFQQRKNPVNIWDPTLVLWTDHRASFRVGMEF